MLVNKKDIYNTNIKVGKQKGYLRYKYKGW